MKVPEGSYLTQCDDDGCKDFAACPAGYSSGTQLDRSCRQCNAGKTSSPASTNCRDCVKGKFGIIDSSGAGVCNSCLPGYFQPEETSATSCASCPSGWMQESKGESSCKDLGGKKPSECKDDEYFNVTLKPENCPDCPLGDCESCPLGASCVGPITFSDIKAKFGWSRCPNLNLTFELCVFGAACNGAPNPRLAEKFQISDSDSTDPALLNQNESCSAAYLNNSFLCAACAESFSHSGIGTKCDKCPSTSNNNLIAIFGGISGIIFIIIFIRLTLSGEGRIDPAAGAQSIGLSYIQITSLMSTFPIEW